MSNRVNHCRRGFLRHFGLLGGAAALGLNFPSTSFAADAQVRVLNSSGLQSGLQETMIENLGYARQFGLEIEFQNVADGTRILSGLIGGAGDACSWSGFPQVLPAIEKGAKIKIIGGSLILPAIALVSAKPDVKSLKDLEGKTVAAGSFGSILYMGVIAAMRKYNVDETKVKFVNVGSSQDTVRAVVAGTVDAGLSTHEVQGALQKFGIHNVQGGVMWEELPNFTWQAAYASDETIIKKRDALVQLLAVNAKLYRFLQSPESWNECDKAFRAESGADYDPAVSKAYWDFFQTRKPMAVDLVLSKERIDYVQKLNLSLGTQKIELPYEQIADMSLAQDALKLLN